MDPKIRQSRILGLPVAYRLQEIAATPGPALVLTTEARIPLFQELRAFGAPATLAPTVRDVPYFTEKTVLSIEEALKPFPKNPAAYTFHVKTGNSYPRETLLDQLVLLGYERDDTPGFVVQGDTIIIGANDIEYRLIFFGDELEDITADGAALPELILPALELPEDADEWGSDLLATFPGPVFLDAPELYEAELGETNAAKLWARLAERTVVSFGRDPLQLPTETRDIEPLGYYRARLSDFSRDVDGWIAAGYAVNVLLKFPKTGDYLLHHHLSDYDPKWVDTVTAKPGVHFVLAKEASGGYRDATHRIVVLSEELLYGAQGARRRTNIPGKRVHDASQLTVGDYLIHPEHGIGAFVGLEARKVLGVARDYLLLRYAGEGKLYLPVEQLSFVRRHPGTTDDPPRLSTLGTNEWSRARERARASAELLAQQLILTYAKRQVSEGTAFPADPEWDSLIAENFPFELTRDQAAAIEAVYRDMEKTVPMERLVSGDVGFGKTEIAIRAAHRAVGNGAQVAVLVPTTVLAKQHYDTFIERFENIPVSIAMLSRFTSDREATKLLKDLQSGAVDIVIGTHRLLNEQVKYHNLGLLVIDEEHRFGVAQKEKLKSIKENVDQLSLSATPIPRTLYMSLIGLRDVSRIATPPAGRKPIQTVLQRYDSLAVREAIMTELERGGKVFYIHDRVASMGLRARTLSVLVPEARIGVVHGQMHTDDVEEVLLGFQEGLYDVLLATTIVESGLDIAGANTLIIERADRLGLAQLYQLRGRVGRRQTEAWAYLFYPGRITEAAQRRLYAVAELNDLGSGHLLAEKDMEIRGVGNILGPEQHGNINAVSLEVYTELLAEEVAKLKGEELREQLPALTIDLSVDARIPPSYIADDDVRINFYGRLGETTRLAELATIRKEMREQFGPFPTEVRTFLDITRLRLVAAAKGVAAIKEHLTDIQLSFEQDFESLDYDPKRMRELPVKVTATRYPPGFSMKKARVKPETFASHLLDILYLVG